MEYCFEDIMDNMDDMDNIDNMGLMSLIVILDDGNELRVTDDVKLWNTRTYKYDKIIMDIKIKPERSIKSDASHFVHENGVIYVPTWMHHEFVGIFAVEIKLIDPKTIPIIDTILIKPSSTNFYEKYTTEMLEQLFQGIDIIMKNPPVTPGIFGFEIEALKSINGTSIEFGTTYCRKPTIQICDTIPTQINKKHLERTQAPVSKTPIPQTPVSKTPIPQTPVSKTPIPQTPVSKTPIPQASTNVDFSATETIVYKRKYIRNGEIIYVK
jgi:hypothetical protein